jgi:hypothetical protein
MDPIRMRELLLCTQFVQRVIKSILGSLALALVYNDSYLQCFRPEARSPLPRVATVPAHLCSKRTCTYVNHEHLNK